MAGAAGAALGLMGFQPYGGKKEVRRSGRRDKKLYGQAGSFKKRYARTYRGGRRRFRTFAAAYSLPSSTDEEKAEKEKIMASALKEACQVPLAIMEKGAEILDIVEILSVKGSVMAVSDAGVAAQFTRTAVLGASMNVYINTKTMKDRTLAEEYNEKADND